MSMDLHSDAEKTLNAHRVIVALTPSASLRYHPTLPTSSRLAASGDGEGSDIGTKCAIAAHYRESIPRPTCPAKRRRPAVHLTSTMEFGVFLPFSIWG